MFVTVAQSPDALAQWWLQNSNTTLAPDAGMAIPISRFSSRWGAQDAASAVAADGARPAQPPSLSFAASSGSSRAATPAPDEALAAVALSNIRAGVTRVPVSAITPPRPAAAAPAAANAEAAPALQSVPEGEGYAARVARSAALVAASGGNSSGGLVWSSPFGTAFHEAGSVTGAFGHAESAVAGAAGQAVTMLREGLGAALTPIANATAAKAAATDQALTQGIGELWPGAVS